MQTLRRNRFKQWSALALAGALACLASCDTAKRDIQNIDQIDPTMNLRRDDYVNMAKPKKSEEYTVTIDKGAPPIPQLEDILAAPRPPKIGETQLVSIAVTDDVPLKDVLLEIAKLADVDIELDAGITGGISFIAKDKPFNEVIDRIAGLANLRYTMTNGVLRVERDTPYIKNYTLDFLNMDRDSDSAVSLSTNVLSSSGGSSSGGSSGGGGGGGGGSGGLNTGSTSSVKSKTTGDFWKSMESGVQQILSYQAPQHVSDTTLQAETDANTLSALTGPPGSRAPGATNAASAVGAAASAAAASTASQSALAGNPASSAANSAQKSYTINRQAGVLTVNATAKQHEMLERLIAMLKKNASAQVLIEAKIIEVNLDQSYQSGINWARIGDKLNVGVNFNTVGNALGNPAVGPLASAAALTASSPTTNVSTLTLSSGSIDALLTLVQQFGTTRTLSSPRLHAINNQQSTMTFAENKVYFQVSINTTTNLSSATSGGAASQTTVNSTVSTVPIGIMMTMMPSIDTDDNEVTLSVRPTLSTVIDEVADPAVALEAAQAGLTGVQNLIPEVQVRELDSTLKVKSGQTMVIGGLMQQTGNNTDIGVPFLSSVPYLGNLFKNVSRDGTNKELVLLIKATIVDSNGDVGKVDKDVFHKFSNDPRPVSF